MSGLIQWFAAHKLSTHSIAAGILFLVGAYKASTPFHELVNKLGAAHPNVAEYVVAGVSLFLLYWASRKVA